VSERGGRCSRELTGRTGAGERHAQHANIHTHTHERSRRLSGGDEQLRGFGIFNGLSGQPDQCVAANWLCKDVRCRRSFRCYIIIFVEFPPYHNNNYNSFSPVVCVRVRASTVSSGARF